MEKTNLNQFTSSLSKEDIIDIYIYGYCDDRGSDAYNRALSQRRADAIRAILVSENIPDSIIKDADGKGELLLKKLSNAKSETQRALNRKAEIIVSLKQHNLDSTLRKEKKKSLYKDYTKDKLEKGDRILLENIHFKTNYSYLKKESYEYLKKVTAFLNDHPEIYFKIEGHVCCIKSGRDGTNFKTGKRDLSKARAALIYNYLADHGIAKERMRYDGFGSKFPLGGDYHNDKRVEIVVTYIKKAKEEK